MRMRVVLLVALAVLVTCAAAIPPAYRIPNVPYHRQINDYSCGCASMEMVLHFYGEDVNQQSIIDVARTTETGGTLAIDLTRVSSFSALNGLPPGTYVPFPSAMPTKGWSASRPVGLATGIYRTDACWLDQLRPLIAAGYPIAVLQWYDATKTEGHFRVAVGYDETARTVTMHDPWDREGQPRLFTITESEFCNLWNHAEPHGDPVVEYFKPYAAIFAAPWQIDIQAMLAADGNYTITADVTYPCPAPFTPSCVTATSATAYLTLPPALRLLPGQQPTFSLGSLAPGATARAQWRANPIQPPSGVSDIDNIVVAAQGLIQNSMPWRAGWTPNTKYPEYSYTDLIGSYAVRMFSPRTGLLSAEVEEAGIDLKQSYE